MTIEQLNHMRAILSAVTEAVAAGGSLGAPAGILYATLMTKGCTLSNFQAIMSALVQTGKITQQGDLYFSA
jgi:hypothetical protein